MSYRVFSARLFLLGVLFVVAGCSGGDPAPDEGNTPVASAEADTASESPSPLTITQQVAPAYTPGAPLTVKATMNYTGSDPVTALALRTTLPAGWQYAGIQGELRPALEPPVGATGYLTMIWIQIPPFPATVEYTIDVPDWAEGTYTVEAQGIYRTLGGELQSPANLVSSTYAK